MKSSRPSQSSGKSPAEPRGSRRYSQPPWHHAVVILGLLLINLLLYCRTLNLGFLSVDDGDYVQNDPFIDGFGATNLKRIFTAPYAANYAPLNLLSYALDVALAGGKNALAFHLSNVLWHGWVVCAVYLLAFTISSEMLTAAAAALLFLLHPAHVEVVAWISSRKDLVATGFAVLSMACYLICRRRVASRPWWYAASLFSFILASAAKQSVVLLPIVMLVWDLLVENRRSWRMLIDKVPFLLVTIFFGWMTWHAQPGTNQASHPFVLAGTEFTNLWLLTGLGQYVLYRSAPDPSAWGLAARGAAIVAAVLVWALPLLFLKLRQPVRAALCYWALIQMVPPMLLSFIVPVTDRYLFLPSVGVCILVADLAVSEGRRMKGEGRAQRADLARPSPGAVGSEGQLFRGRHSRPAPEERGESRREGLPLNRASSPRPSPPLRGGEGETHLDPHYQSHPPSSFSLRTSNGASLRWLLWRPAIGCAVLFVLGVVWTAKTWNYLNEWRDPRSVWYGAHFKTKTSQVSEFLGDVYQEAGDRIRDFVQSSPALQVTNELRLAQAVLVDPMTVERMQAEWLGRVPTRTNSVAYRDRLWGLAWEQYEAAVARRGRLSAPNLFMNRGRLLVSLGKFQQAIPEFETALAFAQKSNYEVIRQGTVTHALYAIGVAHWHMRQFKEAQRRLLQAQEVQKKSGQVWIGELDLQVERIKNLAGRAP